MEEETESTQESPPVALRTRSRSRYLSVESNDAGIITDAKTPVTTSSTPKKRLTSTSTPRRKRTSMKSQLKEIVDEQPKNDGSVDGKKLQENKTGTKIERKKNEKISEVPRPQHIRERDEMDEISPKERVSKMDSEPMEEVVELAVEVAGKSLQSASKNPENPPAKSPEKSTARSPEKLQEKNPEKSPKPRERNPEKLSPMKISKKLKNSGKASDLSPVVSNNSKQEAKQVEVGANTSAWPVLDDLSSLWTSRGNPDFLVKSIEKAYSFVNEIDPAVLAISQELITTDSETIWQQIAYGNKKFDRYFAKRKHLLDVELPVDKKTETQKESTSVVSKPEFLGESSDEEDAGNDSEEDDVDLFNLTEDQIKNLEKDLEDEQSENDDIDSGLTNSEDGNIVEESEMKSKKRWKSVVDDRFFSLAEMEEYLDKQEKDGAGMDEDFFEQFDKDGDDLRDVEADYRYEDFFGNTDNALERNSSNATSRKAEKSKKDAHYGEVEESGKKRVTFADEVGMSSDDDEEEEDMDDNSDDGDDQDDMQEAPVLLGQVDEEEQNETEFQRRQKKLQERITSIEEANLAPRSWDLSGEVTAVEREENTMLEKHLDFDQSAPCPPVITVDVTAQLEAMIIQRIKDRAFDDVIRTAGKAETSTAYRAPVAEEEVVKKSLAEVYEEQYQKTQYGVEKEGKPNEKHEEIKKLMSSLFQKLNALCHYRYIPPEVQPEVRIVNNMPSLQKEEVGPMASTDAVLLAPEEIHKHVSGPIKGDDEKTKTDRSRAHRRKKKWQHNRELKRQQAEFADKGNEVPVKKQKFVSQYDNKIKATKLTSTSFFQRLQDTAAEEVRSKKQKMDETGATRKKLSTKYKL